MTNSSTVLTFIKLFLTVKKKIVFKAIEISPQLELSLPLNQRKMSILCICLLRQELNEKLFDTFIKQDFYKSTFGQPL